MIHMIKPRHLTTPLPLVEEPLPTPPPALALPAEAPPLVPVALATPDAPLPPAVPRDGTIVCLEPLADAGAEEYLEAGLELVGGFSTKDVSVVKKVASTSAG